jgi:hypothetical protein
MVFGKQLVQACCGHVSVDSVGSSEFLEEAAILL